LTTPGATRRWVQKAVKAGALNTWTTASAVATFIEDKWGPCNNGCPNAYAVGSVLASMARQGSITKQQKGREASFWRVK